MVRSGGTTPPGWFEDPWESGCLRWWDGHRWTPRQRPSSPPTNRYPAIGHEVGLSLCGSADRTDLDPATQPIPQPAAGRGSGEVLRPASGTAATVWVLGAAVVAVVAVLVVAVPWGSPERVVAETQFLDEVRNSTAANPGSIPAEEDPVVLTEHLSWQWPEDEVLISQGQQLCEASGQPWVKAVPINSPAGVGRLPFLGSYSEHQIDALISAATTNLCPEHDVWRKAGLR